MQKFKQMQNAAFKAVYAGERTRDSVWHARGWTAANEHGKFVYGANNTLTQAARWRIASNAYLVSMRRRRVELWRVGDRRWVRGLIGMDRAAVRSQRECAKLGGCYLP